MKYGYVVLFDSQEDRNDARRWIRKLAINSDVTIGEALQKIIKFYKEAHGESDGNKKQS